MFEMNFIISSNNHDHIACGADGRQYVIRKADGIIFVKANTTKMVDPYLQWATWQEAQTYARNCEEALQTLQELINLGIRVGDAEGEPVFSAEDSLCHLDEQLYVWCPSSQCTAKFLRFTELLANTYYIGGAVRWDDDTPMEPTLFEWNPINDKFIATSHPWLRLLFPTP